MRVISVSILTGSPTRRFHLEPIFRSSGVGFARHYIDSRGGRNVTDGDRRLVGRTLRGQASPPASGGLPRSRVSLMLPHQTGSSLVLLYVLLTTGGHLFFCAAAPSR